MHVALNGTDVMNTVKRSKYYPPYVSSKMCVSCYYARMRTDICGIYCTGGFVKADGTCDKFKYYSTQNEKNKFE